MNMAMALVLFEAGSLAPGRVAVRTEVLDCGSPAAAFCGAGASVSLPHSMELDDTVITLQGRWGVTTNLGNFDTDPEFEIVCRLSRPTDQNLNTTRLVVLDNDFSVMWQDSWGYSGNPEMASVTVADIDLDGRDDIIIPFAETFFTAEPKYKCRVFVLDGMTGEMKPGWPFIFPGWPEDPYHDTHSEVAVGDIDSDDTLEIVVQVEDLGSIRKPGCGLYVLGPDGDSLWKHLFYDDTLDRHGAYTSPALCDLDGDGLLEIVCHVGRFEREWPYPVVEKRLFIMNSDGTVRRDWQTEGPGGGYSPDYASPTVGDITGDGTPEIVLARRSGWLDCFDTLGTMLPGFPVNLTEDAGYYPPGPMTRAFATPVLADLNNDLWPEIIAGTSGRETCNTRWAGRVHVFNPDGSPFHGFPVPTRNAIWYSPAVGNVDSTTSLEILTSGCDSSFYVLDARGDSLEGWPVRDFPTYWLPDRGSYAFLEGIIPMSRTPFLVDLDSDGMVEILMEGADGTLHTWDTDGPYEPTRMPCPTFRFDKERTGWYRPVGTGISGSRSPGRVAVSPWSLPEGSLSRAEVSLELHLSRPFLGTVALFDQSGRQVGCMFSGSLPPGRHRLTCDSERLGTGVYFARATGIESTARITVVR